jgi:hypothetical protein
VNGVGAFRVEQSDYAVALQKQAMERVIAEASTNIVEHVFQTLGAVTLVFILKNGDLRRLAVRYQICAAYADTPKRLPPVVAFA